VDASEARQRQQHRLRLWLVHHHRLPDDKLTVVALTNPGASFGGDRVRSTGLAIEIAGHYIPGLGYAPSEDKEPQITRMVREVLLKLSEGNVDLNKEGQIGAFRLIRE
jgi:hypothetical protein